MKTTYQYLTLILLLGLGNTSFAQSLYEDAIRLADAIEKQELWLIVESDTTTQIDLVKGFEETEPFAQLLPPLDSVAINQLGQYALASSGQAFDVTLRYDTTRFSVPSQGQRLVLQNSSLYGGIFTETDSLIQQFPKPNILQIHAILGTHASNDLFNEKEALYQPIQNFELYQNNPYLGRLLPKEWFVEEDWMDIPFFTYAVNQQIQDKKALYVPLFQKLYEDSLGYSEQLLTIKGIQTEYEAPAISSSEELSATAEILEANTPDPALDFSTTTLIAGLSDFITERAQEEFNITFMERFRERLNDPAYSELHVLFPESRDFLNQIDIANYKSALLSARQVFASDVQKLSFNLPKVFELPKYESVRNIPEMYNLLIIYSVIDLIHRDNQMEDILPLTFRKVQNRFNELHKAINLRLAEQPNAAADRAVLTQRIQAHEEKLASQKAALEDRQAELGIAFAMAALNPDLATAEVDQLYFDYYEQVNTINNALNIAWDTIRQIPANLQGQLLYDDWMEEPSIDKYENYFAETPNATELIGAGLFMSRTMVNGVYGTPSKAHLLRKWDELLQRTQARFDFLQDSIQAMTDWGLNQKAIAFEEQRLSLQQAVVEDIAFWQKHGAVLHDSMAMTYLSKTLDDPILVAFQGNSIIENLEIKQARLQLIKTTLLEKLVDLNERTQQKSPLLTQLEAEGTEVLAPMLTPNAAIDFLIEDARSIGTLMSQMDQTYAKDLLVAERNAAILSKVLELTSHLFLFLRTGQGDERTWLDTDQWNDLMQHDTRRDVFMGLLYQRMKNLYPSGDFHNKGLATVATNMVYNLAQLKQHRSLVKVKKEINQPLRFEDYLPFVKIAVNLMNGVLETPLLLDENKQTYSLTERDTALAFIPQISNHTVNLFENVNDRQFNFAIYNTLELYKIISERTLQNCYEKKGKDQEKCYQNEKLRNGILVYGTFIADIALASEPEDIKRALELVALPPGSSRLKRQNNYNVSLNSYFGLGVGNERLTNPALRDTDLKLNSIGLTVPIGISASWKLSPEQKGSFSIFMPIIDLGAVTAFRLNEEEQLLPELKFQNIISPGAYFLYNFQKSPFTLGLGTQYGPQVRKITRGATEYETGAWRIMFTATVDVPLFNLFGNRY